MQVEFVLLILSLLFFVSIFADKIGYKFGVPALLLFLIVGMLFGSNSMASFFGMDGVTIDTNVAQALSTMAMCIILFTGGMETKFNEIKTVIAPGVTLATLGVILTCFITGVIIYYLFSWINAVYTMSIWTALLTAATMSSTDSASVFSVLRTNGVGLKHNLRPLLELESGANDPMAYVLTSTLIGVVVSKAQLSGSAETVTALPIIQTILIQLVMGSVLGFAFGQGIVAIMRRVKLGNESLYPIMILTACIFIFSITYYLKGNTYLAVYVGGLIIGNSKFTRKRQTRSFFNGLAWLSQLVMFLMLGLMVQPMDLYLAPSVRLTLYAAFPRPIPSTRPRISQLGWSQRSGAYHFRNHVQGRRSTACRYDFQCSLPLYACVAADTRNITHSDSTQTQFGDSAHQSAYA